MHDTSFSCCCSKIDCLRLKEFNESFKRSEYDALLAAEIGQALLKEQDGELQYNTIKDNYHELKQLRWENKQSDEMIQMLTANAKELKIKIEEYEKELLKNKVFERLLSVKTDMEEQLKTQISDLKQELSQLRKSENNMTCKYKRLYSNHETLKLTHEALLQEHDGLLLKNKVKSTTTNTNTNNSNNINNTNNTTTNNAYSENVIPEAKSNKRQLPQIHVTVTHPFNLLHAVTQHTFDKINATDTRVLNRRLKRVFDMSELSDLSNSILSHILVDLKDFKTQFECIDDKNLDYFFPLVLSIQALLKEICTIKMTLNDLQADYVKRIERLTIIQPMISAYHQQRHLSRIEYENKKSFMQGILSLFTYIK